MRRPPLQTSIVLSFAFLVPSCSVYGSVDSTATLSFSQMSKLVKRLDVLESTGPETILDFYSPRRKSFSIKPSGHSDGGRMCITSTCYALLTLSLCSNVYNSIISPMDEQDDEDETSSNNNNNNGDLALIPIHQVMKALLASKCREDDLFQIPLLLHTLLTVDTDRSLLRSAASNEHTAAKIKKLISTVMNARPHRSSGAAQTHSDYVIYQICKVLAQLQEDTVSSPILHTNANAANTDNTNTSSIRNKNGKVQTTFGRLPKNLLPENISSDVFWALLRCNEVSFNELCRQLSYRAAGDRNLFDVIRLAYCLLTYIRSTESIILSGVAGHEVRKGKGSPAPDTHVNPLNQRLVVTALDAFFQEQNDDGMWDKGQPIYKNFDKGKGRNMGNAFVFHVNVVGSLLCALPAEKFRPHLGALEKTLKWIEAHQTVEMITNRCDDEGICYGKPLRGWSSPNLSPGSGPQAWPTAQVFKCTSWMKRTIQQLMHNDVLEEFNGVAHSTNNKNDAASSTSTAFIPTEDSWDRLLDADLGDPSKEGGCRTIKSVLEERSISPFLTKSIDNPSVGAAYSAVLFGPPGTAKTTICEALAQRLGYDFVCIDTAAFLADGLTNVAARIRYVFSRLMALKNCVILFDEIEEFVLDRENKDLSMESRMLTTAMLTAINDLRRNKKSLFFIATNRLRAIDSAVIRPGRFDMHLFVGTPNLEARVIQLKHKLLAHSNTKVKARVVANYRMFLESVWSEDAMFMNYLEGLQFASACADIVMSKNELTKDDMSVLLKKQAAVMTVRGSARDEYLSSMELSRL